MTHLGDRWLLMVSLMVYVQSVVKLYNASVSAEIFDGEEILPSCSVGTLAEGLFYFVTKHACNGRPDGQHFDCHTAFA